VCSSIIEAILAALPSMVESNWKSSAHTTLGASATISAGHDDTPARLRGLGCARGAATPFLPHPVHLLVHLAVLVMAQRRPRTTEPMARGA
jgi:hypothetical protein